jgi:hypothetical protein
LLSLFGVAAGVGEDAIELAGVVRFHGMSRSSLMRRPACSSWPP